MRILFNAAPLALLAVFATKAHKSGMPTAKIVAGTAVVGGVIGLIEYGIAHRSTAA